MEKDKGGGSWAMTVGAASPAPTPTPAGNKPVPDNRNAPPPSSTSAVTAGSRRHSTRSVKAPTPFSPPMGGNKGVSTTAKRAIGGSASGVESKGRFVPTLYDMVEETHDSQPDIVSWSRDGKSFTIDQNHPELEIIILKYFSHGKLRSLQRQLSNYGWTMDGTVYRHPNFFRGMGEDDMMAIPRRDRTGSEANDLRKKAARRSSNASSKGTNDGDDWSIESLPNFAQTIHTMLEESRDAAIMHWSAGGKAFVVNTHHPELGEILDKYFHHKNYLSFHRQLNQYGWTKPQAGDYGGMLFNPAFYRGMPERNFDLIRRKDSRDYIPLAKQLRLADKPGSKKKVVKRATASKFASAAKGGKKKKPASHKLPPLPGAAIAIATSGSPGVSTGKKLKMLGGKGTSSGKKTTTDKKRKNAPGALPGRLRLKKKKKLSIESLKAQKRLEEYSHLHGMFDSWSLFSMPPDLKSHIKKKKSKKTSNYIGKEGVDGIRANARFLICEETMPDWLAQDEKETLKELEEMIIRDRRQRQARQDAWSRKYSIAKGRTLPPAKFNKPTNKWQKVSPGDHIDVYWHDDQQYYTAKIIKNQEGTTYFHLYYEDDGATEWLDLSREDFKLLEPENLETAVAASSDSGASKRSGVDETPQKDNRRNRPQPLAIPENYAHLAPYLRFSWGLGRNDTGTSAYNQFIKTGDSGAAPVSPLNVLQDIRSIRTQGFSLQPDKDLLVTDNRNNVNTKTKMALRDLQHAISQDHEGQESSPHFEETLATVRRVSDLWDYHTLIGNMQKMETRVSALDEREARVLEKLRKKNLI